jgi:hypothetical protein
MVKDILTKGMVFAEGVTKNQMALNQYTVGVN